MKKKITLVFLSFLLVSFSNSLLAEIDHDKNPKYEDENEKEEGPFPHAKLHLNLLKKKHYAPMPVELDASGPRAKKGKTIVLYEFDFGDGSGKIQQAQSSIKHTYEILENIKEKKIVVKIRVQDSDGKWSKQKNKTLELKQIPDPGENGKKTVAGIDLDENGIRDDIDRLINFQFKNLTVLQRQALRQYAVRTQTELTNSKNKTAIVNLWQTDRSTRCLAARMGMEESFAAEKIIETAYLNTDERALASVDVGKQLAGESTYYNTRPSEYIKHCKDQF